MRHTFALAALFLGFSTIVATNGLAEPRQTPAPNQKEKQPVRLFGGGNNNRSTRDDDRLPKQKQKPVTELVKTQDPPKISPSLLSGPVGGPITIMISLSKQRLYFIVNGETLIDSPISSGKRSGMTPKGTFSISEKDLDHYSSIYGAFVDRNGRVVRSGVSTKKDSAPAGTRFKGAPMKYFMRLTDNGVGMHVGILPGYPASHGCIRLPEQVAKLIYERVSVGQKVTITD